MMVARPNDTHRALARLEQETPWLLSNIITQNVDSLHSKAGNRRVMEMHGTLRDVICLGCSDLRAGNIWRVKGGREMFQNHLRESNVAESTFAHLEMELVTEEFLQSEVIPVVPRRKDDEEEVEDAVVTTGKSTGKPPPSKPNPRPLQQDLLYTLGVSHKNPSSATPGMLRPDGDIDLADKDISQFRYPACPRCLSRDHAHDDQHTTILKPRVTFFGENMTQRLRDETMQLVRDTSLLLVMGTSLEVFSSYRLVRAAVENNVPVLILNLGPTRADGLSSVKRIQGSVGEVLPAAVELLLRR